MLLQMNSHCDYTQAEISQTFSRKFSHYQTQAGIFKFAYCSGALESSDWFPLMTYISSHQSGLTLSLIVYVGLQYVNMPMFLRIE